MMYRNQLVYGFHGLDKDIGLRILTQEQEFKRSNNRYDWLGEGIYFWENNLARAWQYAETAKNRKNSSIKTPYVLGAILELGNCLDLLNQEHLALLEKSYDLLKEWFLTEGKPLPKNTGFNKNDFDFKKRQLDCAVIRMAHSYMQTSQGTHFDSVRAAFWEGEELYEGAGFRKQNHIQIAILNPNCIKGVFLPRDKVSYP
jgi:hypothetical protein